MFGIIHLRQNLKFYPKKSLLSNPEISDWKKAFIFLSLLFGGGWDEDFKLLLGRAWHRRLLQILRYWPL